MNNLKIKETRVGKVILYYCPRCSRLVGKIEKDKLTKVDECESCHTNLIWEKDGSGGYVKDK